MNHFVVVTFDITDGAADDYEMVYEGFEKLGLRRRIKSSKGKEITLPTTTTAGEVDGQNIDAVRDDLCMRTNAIFAENDLHGKIFVSVAEGCAWSHHIA